mgnify:FL=1
MSEERNGWPEWSKYVIEELKRLNLNQEKLQDRIVEFKSDVDSKLNDVLSDIHSELEGIKTKVAQIEPVKLIQLQVDVEGLKNSEKDHESRVRALEKSQSNFSGKWTIVAAIGSAILAAVVSMLLK